MARESFATIARRRLLGLTYLVVLAGLVMLSIAVYNKAFTNTVTIKLKTDHTGNQLLEGSDVKARGLIVGSVKKVKATGDGATVTLALQPSRVKLIPADVTAQILPKTLFGEQYVSLVIAEGDETGHINGGDTISQDRSSVALETERVLGDLLPLIKAVKPAELNATLTAMATALKGRGEQLGQTLVTMDNYLNQLNPSVDQLVDDVKQLGTFADQLNVATPDLLQMLDNFQTGARTVIQKQDALDAILKQASSTSNLLNDFLAENRSRLITIVSTTDSIYSLLNEYTPEYSCMIHGLATYFDRANRGIKNNQIQLNAQLFIAPSNYAAYHHGNEPIYITGVGPACYGLPNPQVPFVVPSQYRCLNDGAPLTADARCTARAKVSGADQSAVGSEMENAELNAILGPTLDTAPDKVPGVARLLIAPTLRGQVVTVK
jgi:virulence factor Mce-like protein